MRLMDITDIYDLLRATQDAYPDNVNPRATMPGSTTPTCMYNGPNGTHCFIGQTLADQGYTIEAELEGKMANLVIPAVTGWELTREATHLAVWAQGEADVSVPWGQIDLEEGREYVLGRGVTHP